MAKTLRTSHDVLLLDLDGTLYAGNRVLPYAVEALAWPGTQQANAPRCLYVTNNASRSVDEVAAHLNSLGFAATNSDIITSAHAAAKLLSVTLRANASSEGTVLVVGTDALVEEVRAVGLSATRSFGPEVIAVVQGHSTHTGWADLAEAALAIRAGATWIAANIDATLPTERGLLPGNGSMVAALQAATNETPIVAGKPGNQIFHDALSVDDFVSPLVVGDRLDTDIAGANAMRLPSLYVMTGVSQPVDILAALPGERPTYIGADLRALDSSPDVLRVKTGDDWSIHARGQTAVTVSLKASSDLGDSASALRELAAVVWPILDTSSPECTVSVVAQDAQSQALLNTWLQGKRVMTSACGRVSASVISDE
ncbi:HAD hydrolase-like protein [Hoyosella rhizosphaerae]|uniref:HAD-superfamily hydrolase n=1 Tax=Hoyosella rhizosphaerae TaxID=1755582 RepID=A0A916U5Y7_9ACTN|nr:HAD hydrolase-like protein [Hoyosella rhizosphaerae]MBN4926181.1 HAD hydrolase-like protein [Hoyosella rhizosphaerae]GGC61460.1 HAD-superfamily hydrolase [Hoyosella rhizosphaerae]